MILQQPARSPAHYSTRADLDSFSSGSPLEGSKLVQTMFDVLAIGAGVLLACATGVGFAFALFCLFFVRIP